MNTIKLKVEAAMRKSWSAYYGYNHWLQHRCMFTKCTKGDAIYCRTIAVVQHDRVLNDT